jgi:hypothetical protein
VTGEWKKIQNEKLRNVHSAEAAIVEEILSWEVLRT